MDEWNKIAEELVYHTKRPATAIAAKLREMGEFALTSADYIAALKTEVAALEADRDVMQQEIELLKKFYEHDHQLCLDQAAIVIEANTEVNQLRAERDAAYQEVERSGSAISETLRLADFLAEAAARGAGFADHWGERVTQAVEPLRDTKAFESQTLQQNKVLLDANSQFLRERDGVRAERDAAYLEGLEESKSIADKSYFQIGVLKYPCTEVADAIQSRIDEAKGK